MPLQIDAFNKLVKITSPTTSVDAQELHDFIEDYLASPVGMVNDGVWPGSPAQRGDIQKPEGKIEDTSNPGVFSQIILIIHPQWQIQFWGGSGYTRIFGGKIIGGVADEPMLATGTAGDITVLESPVDGLTVVSGSGVTQQDKDDIENQIFARLVETGWSFETLIRLMAAEAAGKVIEAGDNTFAIRDVNDLKDRIVGALGANDGRDITSLDGTP